MNAPLKSRCTCKTCSIRERAICALCDDQELTVLNQIKSYKSFSAGDPIQWRGEVLSFVGSVVTGVATLGKTLEDGRTQMVGLLLPSDFIGRPGREMIEFDVTAATDVMVCCFERRPFERMLSDTPHLSQRLMELTLDELDAARDWMLLLGRKTAREKIATFVDMLVRRQGAETLNEPKADLALPLTRDQIANYLGLTLETVSRQLNQLKREGILTFRDRKHFDVLDLDALRNATGNDQSL